MWAVVAWAQKLVAAWHNGTKRRRRRGTVSDEVSGSSFRHPVATVSQGGERRGSSCTDSENKRLFGLAIWAFSFFWGEGENFVVPKSSSKSCSGGFSCSLKWSHPEKPQLKTIEQKCWSHSERPPRIKGYLSSPFVWATLGFALLANALQCSRSRQQCETILKLTL